MNSRHTILQSRLPKVDWLDEPPEPPTHPSELNLVARLRLWLSKLATPTGVWSSLTELVPLTRMRSWLSELAPLTRVRSPFAELTPLTFARYLIAFFVGVVSTVAWQSHRSGTTQETIAATPAALDSLRQSVDRLAAEITEMRAVEQNVLERVSAPPPRPVATPARNPAQRPSSVR